MPEVRHELPKGLRALDHALDCAVEGCLHPRERLGILLRQILRRDPVQGFVISRVFGLDRLDLLLDLLHRRSLAVQHLLESLKICEIDGVLLGRELPEDGDRSNLGDLIHRDLSIQVRLLLSDLPRADRPPVRKILL